MFDCDTLRCGHKLDRFINEFNDKFKDKMLIINKQYNQSDEGGLVVEIERLINVQFDETFTNKALNSMYGEFFTGSFNNFLIFLKHEYYPKVTQFKFESSVYKFESPLNFLMLKGDF